jgi:hypothetical protein
MALNVIPQQMLGTPCLLFRRTSVDMNVTTDQALTKMGEFSTFFVDTIRVVNASTSLTTAVGGVYDTASKGGVAIVANSQAYSALTGSTLGLDLTIAAAGKALITTGNMFFALTTGQGSAATADIYVFGMVMA